MNSNEILVRLNNKYKKCLTCEKYIHIEKNNIFQRRVNGVNCQEFFCCPLCNCLPLYASINENVSTNLKEVEEIYGNVFTIQDDGGDFYKVDYKK